MERVIEITSSGTLIERDGSHIVQKTREQWKKTHRDFRGTIKGTKSCLWNINGATVLLPVEIIKYTVVCPFQSEIYDQKEPCCNCDEEQQICADDI